MIKEILDRLEAIWALWTGLMFFINFLVFISPSISNYTPNIDSAVDFNLQIASYLIANAAVSAVEGAILRLITEPIVSLLKELGL